MTNEETKAIQMKISKSFQSTMIVQRETLKSQGISDDIIISLMTSAALTLAAAVCGATINLADPATKYFAINTMKQLFSTALDIATDNENKATVRAGHVH